MKILEINKLNKYYKISNEETFHVLKDINISFNTGELVSIKGESGSGKSTFMNIIGGLDSDFTGTIINDGKDFKNLNQKKLDKYRKNKIGFIFQSFNLIPHLTILDNVTIAMTLSNISKTKRITRAKELLEMLGIKDQMNKKPSQLSGGQKQRVAIARALANDPDIILADEPTGALDSKSSDQILQILTNISKSGKLVIMVTHSDKVANQSSRIVEIADGTIVSDRELKENKFDLKDEKSIKVNKERQNLSFLSSVKLALTNMREKKFRNILVAFGASIGIFSVVLMLSLGGGVKDFIKEELTSATNPQQISVSKTERKAVTTSADGPVVKPFTDEEFQTLKNIKNIDYIQKTTAFYMNSAIGYNEKTAGIQQLQVSDQLKQTDYLIGNQPSANEIAISDTFAKELLKDDEDIKEIIGSEVTLYINIKDDTGKPIIIEQKLKVSGIYEMKKFLKSKLMQSFAESMTYAAIDFDYLKDVYKNNNMELKADNLIVYANDINNVSDIKKEIQDKGFYVNDSENSASDILKYLNIATYILAGIAAISLLVSAIMILIVLYISVVERTREIGVMRAIGARRKDIKRIFFTESALIGLFAGVIGVLGAYLVGLIVNVASKQSFDVSIINTSLTNIITGIGVSVVISILAGLMPSGKAAKLDPIESLRHE